MQQGARKARTLLQKLGREPRCTGKSLYGTKAEAELQESFSFAEGMGKGHSRPGHGGENGTRLRRTRYPPPLVSTSENQVYHIWLFDKQSISYNCMERPPYTQFYFAFSPLVIFINKLLSNKKQGTRRKSEGIGFHQNTVLQTQQWSILVHLRQSGLWHLCIKKFFKSTNANIRVAHYSRS